MVLLKLLAVVVVVAAKCQIFLCRISTKKTCRFAGSNKYVKPAFFQVIAILGGAIAIKLIYFSEILRGEEVWPKSFPR